MDWKRGDKYFVKLLDGTCINGTVKSVDNSLGFVMVEMMDKYDNKVGFRADQIQKYELLIKVNTVNKQS